MCQFGGKNLTKIVSFTINSFTGLGRLSKKTPMTVARIRVSNMDIV